MEDEKSHNLSSISWKLRKASDVIQSESKGLRPREVDDINTNLR